MKKSLKLNTLFSSLTITTLAFTLVACSGEASTEPVQDGVPPEETETDVEPVEEEEPEEELEEESEATTSNYNPMNDWIDSGEELPQEEVNFVSVVDGSTIIVENESGEEETISLALIDAPNFDDYYSDNAVGYLNITFRSDTEITLERANPDTDQDGTSLAYVYTGWSDRWSKAHVNENMVTFGYARVDNSMGHEKYAELFLEIEELTKPSGEGIWEIDGYVTEDGFDPSVQ